jgi:hypothetical protein
MPVGKLRGRRGSVWRASAGNTYIMDARVAASPPPRSTRARSPRCRRRSQVPRTEMAARSPTTRWTCTAARASCLGPKQLPRARLPGRADRDHGRRREHPDPQPDHLRPGRDPLPSVRAEGNAGGALPIRSAHRPNSTARCSATSASRCRTRSQLVVRLTRQRIRQPHRAIATQRFYRKLNALLGRAGAGGRHLDADCSAAS